MRTKDYGSNVCHLYFYQQAGASSIMSAYNFGVQGYFVKPNTMMEIKTLLKNIIDYWSDSQHPNL